jgi:hypothetical protein
MKSGSLYNPTGLAGKMVQDQLAKGDYNGYKKRKRLLQMSPTLDKKVLGEHATRSVRSPLD